MKQPRIGGVACLDRQRLRVRWSDGTESVLSLKPAIDRYAGLRPLRKPATFARARIGDWGWAVRWPGGIDIAARTLRRLALEQTGEYMRAGDFKRWRQRHALTQAHAATALGLSLRMVKYYESGGKPIPKTVRLACLGYGLQRAA
ncbi:MAG: DUF2442 domain-containing protein [Rhodospirillales bacterium]